MGKGGLLGRCGCYRVCNVDTECHVDERSLKKQWALQSSKRLNDSNLKKLNLKKLVLIALVSKFQNEVC